jgi:hypothetical protein
LRLRLAEDLAETLVLNEHDTGPEQINTTVVAGDFLNRFFKARDCATTNAEDIEEFVPESLLLCLFAPDARPFLRKGDRAMADYFQQGRNLRFSGLARTKWVGAICVSRDEQHSQEWRRCEQKGTIYRAKQN